MWAASKFCMYVPQRRTPTIPISTPLKHTTATTITTITDILKTTPHTKAIKHMLTRITKRTTWSTTTINQTKILSISILVGLCPRGLMLGYISQVWKITIFKPFKSLVRRYLVLAQNVSTERDSKLTQRNTNSFQSGFGILRVESQKAV